VRPPSFEIRTCCVPASDGVTACQAASAAARERPSGLLRISDNSESETNWGEGPPARRWPSAGPRSARGAASPRMSCSPTTRSAAGGNQPTGFFAAVSADR
jgi:hypothetical protein